MERITSKDNEKIKWLIKLQNSRKVRQESASFVAEGMRLAQEVLRRRYVMGQNFSETAEAMGVVQRRAYQLHRTAVEGMAVPKRA